MQQEDADNLLSHLTASIEASHRAHVELLQAFRVLLGATEANAVATTRGTAASRPLVPRSAFKETDPELAALDADLPGLPNDKGVFTIDEVAKYLRISRTSAYELVRQRKIPAMRIGRSIRIPRRLLAAYLRGMDADAFDEFIATKVKAKQKAGELL